MSNYDMKWRDDYNIGCEDIDLQHHYFLNLITRFIKKISSEITQEQMSDFIDELTSYARFHFLSEEIIMKYNDYPDYLTHKQLHVELLNKLGNKLTALLITSNPKSPEQVTELLLDWFISHTQSEDKNFGHFLKGRKEVF